MPAIASLAAVGQSGMRKKHARPAIAVSWAELNEPPTSGSDNPALNRN
jgi:hypothetical protein